MRVRRSHTLIAAVLAAVSLVAACGGATDEAAALKFLAESADVPDRAGTIVGSQSTPCPARFDVTFGDTGICRLGAGDSTDASVVVPLQAASEANKTRIIYLCDYTHLRTTLTYRLYSNSAWITETTQRDNNPQCSSGKALQLRFDPSNWNPYLYQPNVLAARNLEVKIRIPSCDEAYGWLCPFYNNPSIAVMILDYDSAAVTPTIPSP